MRPRQPSANSAHRRNHRPQVELHPRHPLAPRLPAHRPAPGSARRLLTHPHPGQLHQLQRVNASPSPLVAPVTTKHRSLSTSMSAIAPLNMKDPSRLLVCISSRPHLPSQFVHENNQFKERRAGPPSKPCWRATLQVLRRSCERRRAVDHHPRRRGSPASSVGLALPVFSQQARAGRARQLRILRADHRPQPPRRSSSRRPRPPRLPPRSPTSSAAPARQAHATGSALALQSSLAELGGRA